MGGAPTQNWDPIGFDPQPYVKEGGSKKKPGRTFSGGGGVFRISPRFGRPPPPTSPRWALPWRPPIALGSGEGALFARSWVWRVSFWFPFLNKVTPEQRVPSLKKTHTLFLGSLEGVEVFPGVTQGVTVLRWVAFHHDDAVAVCLAQSAQPLLRQAREGLLDRQASAPSA